MKKILTIALLSSLLWSNENVLKEGSYSWYGGGYDSAYIVVKKVDKEYEISIEAYHGLSRKGGPNMGDYSFKAPLKDGEIIYKEKEYDSNYVIKLKVNSDGTFDVTEEGQGSYGFGVYVTGHFTSDDTPSFDCKKASTFIENAICSNKDIARLDRKMSRAYELASSAYSIKGNSQKELKALLSKQKRWIKKRNHCEMKKTYKLCLKQTYKEQIKFLGNTYSKIWNYDE